MAEPTPTRIELWGIVRVVDSGVSHKLKMAIAAESVETALAAAKAAGYVRLGRVTVRWERDYSWSPEEALSRSHRLCAWLVSFRVLPADFTPPARVVGWAPERLG